MDISIRNPNIFNYLNLKSTTPPMAELKYLFSNPETKPCFLDDVERKVSQSIKNATRDRNHLFPTDQVVKRLVILAYAMEVHKDNKSSMEERERVLRELAEALRYLWNI